VPVGAQIVGVLPETDRQSGGVGQPLNTAAELRATRVGFAKVFRGERAATVVGGAHDRRHVRQGAARGVVL